MITATRRRPGSPQSVLVNEPDMHGMNILQTIKVPKIKQTMRFLVGQLAGIKTRRIFENWLTQFGTDICHRVSTKRNKSVFQKCDAKSISTKNAFNFYSFGSLVIYGKRPPPFVVESATQTLRNCRKKSNRRGSSRVGPPISCVPA